MSDDKRGDLWARITATPRPSALVPFPRNGDDGQPVAWVRLVVLTHNEQIGAMADAERKVRELLKGATPGKDEASGYEALRQEHVAKELLWRACKDDDSEKWSRPFFRTKADIGEHLSADEVGVLTHHYMQLVTSTGPVLGEFGSEEEMDAWLAAVVRSGQYHPLVSRSLGALIQLVIYLAKRVYPSPSPSNTDGSPLDSMPNTSESETSSPE